MGAKKLLVQKRKPILSPVHTWLFLLLGIWRHGEVEMTSRLTLSLACLLDSKDSPCSKKKFSYLDVGDMRIGTILSADIFFLTVQLFTAMNKENMPSKFVCD